MSDEEMNSVCYIYDDKLCDREKPHEAGTGKELVESVGSRLCEPPQNMSHHVKFENKSHDEFQPDNTDHFFDFAKKLTKPGGNDHVFCSALHFYLLWRRFLSFIEPKEVASDGEGKVLEINREEVLEAERTPWFFTRDPGHYQQNHHRKKLN